MPTCAHHRATTFKTPSCCCCWIQVAVVQLLCNSPVRTLMNHNLDPASCADCPCMGQPYQLHAAAWTLPCARLHRCFDGHHDCSSIGSVCRLRLHCHRQHQLVHFTSLCSMPHAGEKLMCNVANKQQTRGMSLKHVTCLLKCTLLPFPCNHQDAVLLSTLSDLKLI